MQVAGKSRSGYDARVCRTMETQKSETKQEAKPEASMPKPAKAPRIVRLRYGKPRIKRLRARLARARVVRPPLPPNFNPRFPDEVDFFTATKPSRQWCSGYYVAAVGIHAVLLAAFGYTVLKNPDFSELQPRQILPTMRMVGDGLAPVGPPAPPAPAAPRDQDLSKLANGAPRVAPIPTLPKGAIVARAAPLPRASVASPVISTFNPKIPGGFVSTAPQRGAFGTSDVFAARRSGASRGGAVARYGGSDSSEAAVLKALRWLKRNQNTDNKTGNDGSWGQQYKVAMTGLALLAFLGHGDTHESLEFEGSIKEGLNFLATAADQSKTINGGCLGTTRFEYQHPIATYALCEDYALTRYAPLKPLCETTVSLIVKAQRPDGSWDYDYNTGPGGVYNLKNRPSGDSSIAAWNVQALVAAKNAGFAVPGLEEALRRSNQWFHNIFYKEGPRFGYAMPDRLHSDALDGIGCLCLQLLGEPRAPEIQQILPRLLNVETRFRSGNANSSYTWYYITQAMFHAGGQWWAEWNMRLRDQIVQNQDEDGSWSSPGSTAWQDNMTANKVKGKDAKVYHTTLMCLTLEVYYRFLPTYNLAEVARREAPATIAHP